LATVREGGVDPVAASPALEPTGLICGSAERLDKVREPFPALDLTYLNDRRTE
jgi:hypothetical protein